MLLLEGASDFGTEAWAAAVRLEAVDWCCKLCAENLTRRGSGDFQRFLTNFAEFLMVFVIL